MMWFRNWIAIRSSLYEPVPISGSSPESVFESLVYQVLSERKSEFLLPDLNSTNRSDWHICGIQHTQMDIERLRDTTWEREGYTETHSHRERLTHTYAQLNTNTHTHTHTNTHAYTHTRARAHTHTHSAHTRHIHIQRERERERERERRGTHTSRPAMESTAPACRALGRACV